MEPTTSESKANKDKFDTAVATRNFEIGLFWQRALFFWGFIGAAFVAFATAPTPSLVQTLLAGFGFVASVVWTLANRGSKYWHESWEEKVRREELPIYGPFFARRESRQDKGLWSAREYSVSKLAIALSDFSAVTWVLFLIISTVSLFRANPQPDHTNWRALAGLAAALGCVAFVALVSVSARSSKERNAERL